MNTLQLSSLSGLDDATMQQKIRELANRYGAVLSLNQITQDTPPRRSLLIIFESGNVAENAAAALGGIMFCLSAVIVTLHSFGHHLS